MVAPHEAIFRTIVGLNGLLNCSPRNRFNALHLLFSTREVNQMTKLHILADHTGSECHLTPRVTDSWLPLRGSSVRQAGIKNGETAEMVHDFRNILGTIHGLADLAFPEVLENSGTAARMDEIRAACRDGGELCQQLLHPFRDGLVCLDTFELAQVVQRLETQLRVCIREKFVLELDLQPAPLLALSNGRLQRIVLNLVKNAAASLEGRPGIVRVRTGTSTAPIGAAAAANVSLAGNDHPTSFLIVSDSGRGMDQSQRASLLKGSLATRSGGHGLGFASVRRMVKSCGGAIRISSEPGHGTTVLVTFPHSDSPPEDIVVDARLNMRPVHPG
ncbi:hypothetical protein AYO47_00365 [Planctomyces sp. SCGC AG-212-M04]|nr:hypothetical protein AYO47_00365 [Planctomyces sp. SCGC AG-212-M04]